MQADDTTRQTFEKLSRDQLEIYAKELREHIETERGLRQELEGRNQLLEQRGPRNHRAQPDVPQAPRRCERPWSWPTGRSSTAWASWQTSSATSRNAHGLSLSQTSTSFLRWPRKIRPRPSLSSRLLGQITRLAIKGAQMPGPPQIAVRRLSHSYATKGAPLAVLSDLRLEVRTGEFVSLIGPSGAGKSTLLKAIGGLLEPSEGTVTIDGAPPEEAQRRKDIGFVSRTRPCCRGVPLLRTSLCLCVSTGIVPEPRTAAPKS